MGKPNWSNIRLSAQAEAIPGKLNHLSSLRKRNQYRNSPSSGERNGKSLKSVNVITCMCCLRMVAGKIRIVMQNDRLLLML